VWQLSDDEVETALAQIERAEAALVARRAELVAEADQRSMKDRCSALSTERWLQDRFRLSHRDAKTRVDQARLLRGQPAAHGALAAGLVTPEQATVVATCLDTVDQLEGVDPVEREQAADSSSARPPASGRGTWPPPPHTWSNNSPAPPRPTATPTPTRSRGSSRRPRPPPRRPRPTPWS
jgi:hypothetical protein